MASAYFPSKSLHSSAFRFSHTPFADMTKFTVDSSYQNLEIPEETSDDDDTNNDGDYSPGGIARPKSRQFTVKYAPQAVVDWYMIALDKKTARKKSIVKEDALGHLLATGWNIYYIQKKTKHELRYKSPNGRVYISLRTACKGCIDEGGATVAAAAPADVPDHSQTEKKDSHLLVEKGKETTSSLKRPKDDSERVKSPVPPVRNWGNKETPPRAAETAAVNCYSRRNTLTKDDSERVKSPVPPVRNWGNKETPPRAAETAAVNCYSRRNTRTALSYLIDQGVVSPGHRVYYKITAKEDPLMAWGLITNEGAIKCDCCSNLFSISHFEAHTGSTKRRPAANIFLEDGRSLMDCQKQLNQNQTQNQNETKPSEKVNHDSKAHSDTLCLDKNDSICSICHFGGELILCDLCPAAFHGSCLGFNGVPVGDWFCPSCCCKICGQVPYDFDGASSHHQIDGSFVKCVQCEQNVHIGCVKSIQVLEDNSNQNIDEENWFCTKRCEDVHMGLQNLLWKQIPTGKKEDNLTWTLMKHTDTMADNHRKKLNIALGVMHESFRPVKDPITKKNLIEDVLFSRRSELKRLNFEGFYTVVLERKNTVTTVATVRVYGDEVAEVPFVATRLKHRRHGMCRAAMNELERQLMKLGVKRLTLPAVTEALNTWTGGFGFSKMKDSDRLELVKYTFLGFQHTVRCQKHLLETRIPNDLEWWPRKRLKQTAFELQISDSMCFDDWNSFSDAFD